jgi:hypothetical protein
MRQSLLLKLMDGWMDFIVSVTLVIDWVEKENAGI